MRWMRPLSVLASIPFGTNSETNNHPSNPSKPENPSKPSVLIAGYGWGAHAFVSELDRSKYNVVVVSERDKRLNQNLMIGTLRASYTSSLVPVIKDTCALLDEANHVVQGIKQQYPYDYLVIATGSEANDFGIAGVRTFCSMCKTGEDIEAIRSLVTSGQLKAATVLGAGPTGVELAMSLRCHGVSSVRLIEGGNQILPGFSDKMRSYILDRMAEKRIDLQLGKAIQAITPEAIRTKTGELPVDSGELLVWTCGIRPVDFVRSIRGRGRALQVDEHLRFAPSVYAIGDSIHGHGPPTAQNARQQGSYLARHFNADFKSAEPYKYRELGRCLDIGDGLIVEVMGWIVHVPQIDIFEYMWMLSV